MKYIVMSSDGYGPKLYTDYDAAKEQAMTYLYLCDDYDHVEILQVNEDTVTKSSFYWEDHVEEATAAYGRSES